jgi:hypothetical protein
LLIFASAYPCIFDLSATYIVLLMCRPNAQRNNPRMDIKLTLPTPVNE